MDAPRAPSAMHVAIGRALRESPKRIPTAYLYDALGSLLFEAICELPYYAVKRAEKALLRRACPEVLATLGHIDRLVELGSGSGDKIDIVVDALATRERDVDVHFVDISRTALELSKQAMGRHGHARVTMHEADFAKGVGQALQTRATGEKALVLFLGSNIGNFDPDAADALLRSIAAPLAPGDGLLLGTDLVKPEAQLKLAYDDPVGVTAAFNKNLLLRLNTEMAADFDLSAYDHLAVWNGARSRMEMYMVSRKAQSVRLAAIDLTLQLAAGERIFTETSHKYTTESVNAMGARAGLKQARQFVDTEAGFASTLFLR